jgi:hypothetical protein
MTKKTVVDVIHSPWCFIEAPEESYKRKLEREWNIRIREFDLWEIGDDRLESLPEHISAEIRRLRDPSGPADVFPAGGSLFFLNGEKLDLSPALKWPQIESTLGGMT